MKSKDLKKMLSYFKPYKKAFWWDMFFAVLGAAVLLVIPLVVRRITNQVIYMEPAAAQTEILKLGLLCLLLILVEFACNYWTTNYGHRMSSSMERDMRAELFAHYQKLSFSFYDEQKVGALMSRVTTDLWELSELFHHGPEDLVISAIKLLGSFAILFCINVKLSLVAIIFVPIMIVYAIIQNKRMREASRNNKRRIGEVNAQIEDNLSGIRVVKSFANESLEQEKFRQGNDAFLDSKWTYYAVMAQYYPVLNGFTTFLNVSVVITGAWFITKGIIQVNDLVTFLLYINNVTEPIRKLVSFTEQYQSGMSGYDRFMEIMNIEPDIQDRPNAADAGNLQGAIDLEDVSFHYEEELPDVLSHVNLNVQPGDYIALVGPSGVGKTTLCNLIPRFYEVSAGAVKVDGRDIRDYTQQSLRRNIGVVQQDVYLFAGSVMENIRYGKPDASDEEIIAAAKAANAHDFIMELPNGYHTDIGQRGVKLSGGQKQRISIARVFLKNPPILIFDEATSALDNKSEKVVQQALEALAKNRTTLVIAHRLSTIRHARRILVLTDDGISEQGTHEELMARNGLYASLYRLQGM